jgi:hypothetical protein
VEEVLAMRKLRSTFSSWYWRALYVGLTSGILVMALLASDSMD